MPRSTQNIFAIALVNSPFKTAEADYTETSEDFFSHGLDILSPVRKIKLKIAKMCTTNLANISSTTTLASPSMVPMLEISIPTVIRDSSKKPSLER